jgi:16S rRNA (adenine1518-N6/adenine1519-N6)-dimethyltransferase
MDNKYGSLQSLRQTVEENGLLTQRNFSKKLGQNFLLDLEITRRIVKIAAPLDGCNILEIGPGPGGLTRAILELKPAKVFAVEKDHQCINALSELLKASQGTLSIIEGDAQKIKPQELTDGPIKIIANLPYNVGTNLLINWLHDLTNISSLTLMFQKEVALRIAANPGSKDYGRLSILSQYLCNVARIFDLPPHVFKPSPKVSSSVIHLVPKTLEKRDLDLVPLIEKITASAFGQRRKMLRASLKSVFSEKNLSEAFETLHIPPTERAENLSVEQYVSLAQFMLSLERLR